MARCQGNFKGCQCKADGSTNCGAKDWCDATGCLGFYDEHGGATCKGSKKPCACNMFENVILWGYGYDGPATQGTQMRLEANIGECTDLPWDWNDRLSSAKFVWGSSRIHCRFYKDSRCNGDYGVINAPQTIPFLLRHAVSD